jgi:hypothetical protein
MLFEKNNDLEGVVYVTDFGFTDVRNKISAQRMIEEQKIDTVEKLRAYNLQEELDDFKDVCKHIENIFLELEKGPKWLIIAVNKVDLYYKDINTAEKYYSGVYESPFSDIANDLIRSVGESRLKYAATPICSWEEPFIWNNQEIVTKLGGSSIKQKFSQELLTKFIEFSK